MANLKTEFCGLEFKNPIVVASAETGNSLDNIKKCEVKWCKVTSGDYMGWIVKSSLWGKIK